MRSEIKRSDELKMAGVFSHNKECDNLHWAGETALNGFEQFILIDGLMDLPAFDNYEEMIENFWPSFTADASIS